MALTPLVVRDGNNVAANQEMLQGVSGAGNNIPVVSLDSTRVTYRASANFTPQPTAAVTVITITGSATKTVRIKRVMMGGVSTAVSISVWALQRTSALGAGGTLVAPTVALLDRGASASYAAATAVVNHWTTTLKAAGTTTSMGGPITTRSVGTNVVTTPATAWIEPFAPLFPEAGMPVGSAIVLRGTSEILEVQNVAPANLGAGTVLSYMIEWEEDNS
jgi:hypothetical protein